MSFYMQSTREARCNHRKEKQVQEYQFTMELQDNNVKFLQFKIEELTLKITKQEQHFFEVNQSKILKIDSLETKVNALETEVKTHKEKAEEWKAQLRKSRDEVERIGLDKAELLLAFQDYRDKTAQTESELRQQKCDIEANARNTIEELKKHCASEIGRMQEGHDTKMAKAEAACQKLTLKLRIAKEWSQRQAAELEELQAAPPQGETDYKDRMDNLRLQILEKDIFIDREEILKKHTRFNELTKQIELEMKIERLEMTLRENADPGETDSNLMDKVRRCEPDLNKEPEKNKNLTTDVMPIKVDLQACMDFTSEPQTLVSKVLNVKRNHTDTESKVQVDGNNEIGLRLAFAAEDQLIDSNSGCHQNSSRAEKLCQEQIFQKTQSNQDQSSLFRQVHDMTVELVHGKTQLTETTRPLELARKPWLQKVKSWLKKKVFSTNKVAPIDAEEPPSRLLGDHTVHRSADNTSFSKPGPYPEVFTSNLWKVIPR